MKIVIIAVLTLFLAFFTKSLINFIGTLAGVSCLSGGTETLSKDCSVWSLVSILVFLVSIPVIFILLRKVWK